MCPNIRYSDGASNHSVRYSRSRLYFTVSRGRSAYRTACATSKSRRQTPCLSRKTRLCPRHPFRPARNGVRHRHIRFSTNSRYKKPRFRRTYAASSRCLSYSPRYGCRRTSPSQTRSTRYTNAGERTKTLCYGDGRLSRSRTQVIALRRVLSRKSPTWWLCGRLGHFGLFITARTVTSPYISLSTPSRHPSYSRRSRTAHSQTASRHSYPLQEPNISHFCPKVRRTFLFTSRLTLPPLCTKPN